MNSLSGIDRVGIGLVLLLLFIILTFGVLSHFQLEIPHFKEGKCYIHLPNKGEKWEEPDMSSYIAKVMGVGKKSYLIRTYHVYTKLWLRPSTDTFESAHGFFDGGEVTCPKESK